MPELTPEKQRALDAKLGKQSDISLAREYGITRQRVGQRRIAKGIPCYKSVTRSINVGTFITKTDHRRMGRAMKESRIGSKSEYMRDAIRDKNKSVLGE